MIKIAVIVICSLVACASANVLESYNIDPSKVSVSGLSAGGFMAAQMHVAYSELFMGVGIIAGGPYYCAKGSLTTATTICMTTPGPLLNVDALVSKTLDYEKTNAIDPVSNMVHDKIYIFSGTEDTTVKPTVVEAVEEYYRQFTSDYSNIRTNMDIAAVHGFPTKNYGQPCGNVNYLTYINNCDEDIAYYMLQHFYKDLQRPVYGTPLDDGALMTFDQTEFTELFSDNGLDNEGYIFVPNQCLDKNVPCRLHLSLHGCKQGKETIGDKYVTETGYLEIAVQNNIIILAPQVKKDFLNNPNGCFDWWGYTDQDYATKNGVQMNAIYQMVQRMISL